MSGLRQLRRLALPALAACMAAAGCGGKGSASGASATASSQPPTTTQPARSYRVPSTSMEPTLKLGAQVRVAPGRLSVGEIVVFHPPEPAGPREECGPTPHKVKPGGAPCGQPLPVAKQSTLELVKRIVAGPGDTVAIRHGHVYRNGQPEPDSYAKPCPTEPQCDFPVPVRVLPGDWYLIGDNRGESNDSRFWGPVPASSIVGVVQQGTST